MTKKLTIAFFLLATTIGFAEELSISQAVLPHVGSSLPQIQPMSEETLSIQDPMKKGIIYFRAITDSQPINGIEVFPGLGLGYRRSFGESGIDVSVNVSEGKGWSGDHRQLVWTAPKVSYLYYFNPKADRTLYSGVGLGWGGTKFKSDAMVVNVDGTTTKREHSDFMGLIPHVSIGYEVLRHSLISSFTELTVSQPLIPSSFHGSPPGPVAELSIGAGF